MQTKKGNQWHFGMKVHIGVDSASGLVHSASVPTANVHDSQRLDKLLLGHETRLYGDSAYRGQKEVISPPNNALPRHATSPTSALTATCL